MLVADTEKVLVKSTAYKYALLYIYNILIEGNIIPEFTFLSAALHATFSSVINLFFYLWKIDRFLSVENQINKIKSMCYNLLKYCDKDKPKICRQYMSNPPSSYLRESTFLNMKYIM